MVNRLAFLNLLLWNLTLKLLQIKAKNSPQVIYNLQTWKYSKAGQQNKKIAYLKDLTQILVLISLKEK